MRGCHGAPSFFLEYKGNANIPANASNNDIDIKKNDMKEIY